MDQLSLLRGQDLPSGYRYRQFFEHLPLVPSVPAAGRGRKPFDHNFLLRALIYRCLPQVPTLAELVFELNNNPTVLGIRNPDHPGFTHKVDWLQRRFNEGLRILLCCDERAKPLAILDFKRDARPGTIT